MIRAGLLAHCASRLSAASGRLRHTAPKLTLDPEELYALPELPERYTALNKQLSAIQESGAEYAAPVSGSNIQPVQMVDLDGDGREEALAFFRQSDGEKPLKIHIFTADDDNSYRQAAVIEGSGLAIAVDYSDIERRRPYGDHRGLAGQHGSAGAGGLSLGSRTGTGTDADQLCEICRGGPERRRMQELTVLRANQDGVGAADCYLWKTGADAQSTIRVSMTMAELSQQGKVTVGTLRSSDPALFHHRRGGRCAGHYGCSASGTGN